MNVTWNILYEDVFITNEARKIIIIIFFIKSTKGVGISFCFYHYCKVSCIALNVRN